MGEHPIDEFKQRLIEDGIPNGDPRVMDFIRKYGKKFRHLREWIDLIGSRVMGKLLIWKETGINLLERLLDEIRRLCKEELTFSEEGCDRLSKAIVYDWIIACVITWKRKK